MQIYIYLHQFLSPHFRRLFFLLIFSPIRLSTSCHTFLPQFSHFRGLTVGRFSTSAALSSPGHDRITKCGHFFHREVHDLLWISDLHNVLQVSSSFSDATNFFNRSIPIFPSTQCVQKFPELLRYLTFIIIRLKPSGSPKS